VEADDGRSLLVSVSLAVDWIIAGAADQWLDQHPVEPQVSPGSELFDADGHGLVTFTGLRPIGPEQTIPPGQVEAEIAVRLARMDRVMNPVHVRRHHDKPQDTVDPGRNSDI